MDIQEKVNKDATDWIKIIVDKTNIKQIENNQNKQHQQTWNSKQ